MGLKEFYGYGNFYVKIKKVLGKLSKIGYFNGGWFVGEWGWYLIFDLGIEVLVIEIGKVGIRIDLGGKRILSFIIGYIEF